jgi:hypothetical protein
MSIIDSGIHAGISHDFVQRFGRGLIALMTCNTPVLYHGHRNFLNVVRENMVSIMQEGPSTGRGEPLQTSSWRKSKGYILRSSRGFHQPLEIGDEFRGTVNILNMPLPIG